MLFVSNLFPGCLATDFFYLFPLIKVNASFNIYIKMYTGVIAHFQEYHLQHRLKKHFRFKRTAVGRCYDVIMRKSVFCSI